MYSAEREPLHEFRMNDRWSIVYKTNEGNYLVRMFENQIWQEDRLIKDHSEVYAENCAENWVLGVIE
tara:strand:+ start:110 stop:310 length:201 start_codon:yes stop_codon:yes gene_type:complete